MLNKNTTSIIFKSALALSAAASFATAADSTVVEKQTSILDKLDSLNEAVLGLRLGGTAKAGGLTSTATSDQFSEKSPTQENQAYTDVNLVVTAQPSSETRATVKLRLHKDWQSAIDENNNPLIGHWFSYDGLILDKHVDFNMGYMRVGYTPLTINVPQNEILQEPEIFTENRIEALDRRNLDTTSRRLMQGLNAAYNSGELGAVSNVYAQVTGARMRNTAKKNDQVFFDFDWSDRYAYGLRGGASAFGATLGVNYVEIFDRKKTTRSREIGASDTLIYDDNSVLSFELGFDSKTLMSDLPVNFGLNGEFAMSSWTTEREYLKSVMKIEHQIREDNHPLADGSMEKIIYVKTNSSDVDKRHSEELDDESGNAFNIQPYVAGNIADIDFKLKAMYLQNDKEFWSDMASSPAYTTNKIVLNANALYGDTDANLVESFASGNLENLYFSIYNTNLLTAQTMMTSGSATVRSGNSEHADLYGQLYNNYKLAHYYRNAYSANSMKKGELAPVLMYMDPSVNLAMPLGLATPDRKGFAADLDAKWNDAISLNVRFSQYNADSYDNSYTTIGAGVGVDIGQIVKSLERQILIQGSFEQGTESEGLKRSSQRIVAGLTADIWGPIALQGGVQMLSKKFEGNVYGMAGLPIGNAFVTNVDEMLVLVGPKIKIAPASYLTVRYGILNNGVDYTAIGMDAEGNMITAPRELSIDKNIITAEVTVNF